MSVPDGGSGRKRELGNLGSRLDLNFEKLRNQGRISELRYDRESFWDGGGLFLCF
jgi:hypothetical protein